MEPEDRKLRSANSQRISITLPNADDKEKNSYADQVTKPIRPSSSRSVQKSRPTSAAGPGGHESTFESEPESSFIRNSGDSETVETNVVDVETKEDGVTKGQEADEVQERDGLVLSQGSELPVDESDDVSPYADSQAFGSTEENHDEPEVPTESMSTRSISDVGTEWKPVVIRLPSRESLDPVLADADAEAVEPTSDFDTSRVLETEDFPTEGTPYDEPYPLPKSVIAQRPLTPENDVSSVLDETYVENKEHFMMTAGTPKTRRRPHFTDDKPSHIPIPVKNRSGLLPHDSANPTEVPVPTQVSSEQSDAIHTATVTKPRHLTDMISTKPPGPRLPPLPPRPATTPHLRYSYGGFVTNENHAGRHTDWFAPSSYPLPLIRDEDYCYVSERKLTHTELVQRLKCQQREFVLYGELGVKRPTGSHRDRTQSLKDRVGRFVPFEKSKGTETALVESRPSVAIPALFQPQSSVSTRITPKENSEKRVQVVAKRETERGERNEYHQLSRPAVFHSTKGRRTAIVSSPRRSRRRKTAKPVLDASTAKDAPQLAVQRIAFEGVVVDGTGNVALTISNPTAMRNPTGSGSKITLIPGEIPTDPNSQPQKAEENSDWLRGGLAAGGRRGLQGISSAPASTRRGLLLSQDSQTPEVILASRVASLPGTLPKFYNTIRTSIATGAVQDRKPLTGIGIFEKSESSRNRMNFGNAPDSIVSEKSKVVTFGSTSILRL